MNIRANDMKLTMGNEPIALVLKDGTVFDFSAGYLYIYDSEEDMGNGKEPLNIYCLEDMYTLEDV